MRKIPPLEVSALDLTASRFKISFVPAKSDARITATALDVPARKMADIQLQCSLGYTCVQVRSGMAGETRLEISLPELIVLHGLIDKFIQELPTASLSGVEDDE